jgi:hypothetical protein
VKFGPAKRSNIDAYDRKILKWLEANRMCTELSWVRIESTGGFL